MHISDIYLFIVVHDSVYYLLQPPRLQLHQATGIDLCVVGIWIVTFTVLVSSYFLQSHTVIVSHYDNLLTMKQVSMKIYTTFLSSLSSVPICSFVWHKIHKLFYTYHKCVHYTWSQLSLLSIKLVLYSTSTIYNLANEILLNLWLSASCSSQITFPHDISVVLLLMSHSFCRGKCLY